MKIIEEKFRCDLCKRFQALGVTESRRSTSPWYQAKSVSVCLDCVEKAAALLLPRSAKLRALAEEVPF